MTQLKVGRQERRSGRSWRAGSGSQRSFPETNCSDDRPGPLGAGRKEYHSFIGLLSCSEMLKTPFKVWGR